MARIPETEKAYLAGILDGEGCIVIDQMEREIADGSSKLYHRLRVTITNTDYTLITWASNKFPKAHLSLSNRIKARPHHRDVFTLVWSGYRAVPLLTNLLPYMIIKKRQAELALDFLETVDSLHSQKGSMKKGHVNAEVINIREGIRDQVRALNRGVA